MSWRRATTQSRFVAQWRRFTSGVGLIPEQIWDAPDIPDQHMFFGRPTGSAIPLMWAHADFVKMMRSIIDKKVFDLLDPVAERYRDRSTQRLGQLR